MAPIRVTFSDLEGHFCCLEPLFPSATVVRVHDGALAKGSPTRRGLRRHTVVSLHEPRAACAVPTSPCPM